MIGTDEKTVELSNAQITADVSGLRPDINDCSQNVLLALTVIYTSSDNKSPWCMYLEINLLSKRDVYDHS